MKAMVQVEMEATDLVNPLPGDRMDWGVKTFLDGQETQGAKCGPMWQAAVILMLSLKETNKDMLAQALAGFVSAQGLFCDCPKPEDQNAPESVGPG